jgi:hypothetical protein
LISRKVKYNIFLGLHNNQIWTSMDRCGQLWPLEWERGFHLQPLWNNLKVFMINGMKFRYRLFKICKSPFQEGIRLYFRQKLVQHHINKEMRSTYRVSLFCPTSVCLFIFHGNVLLKRFLNFFL